MKGILVLTMGRGITIVIIQFAITQLMKGFIDVKEEWKDENKTDFSEDSKRFVEELQKETDRGVALVAAAFINKILETMLGSFFVDDYKIIAQILSNEGSAGTLSRRINLAYALGLMSRKEYKDLSIIRKIRNQFAHLDKPASFNITRINKLCKELTTPRMVGIINNSSRDIFITTAVFITVTILLRGLTIKHQMVAMEFKLAELVKA